MFVNVVAHLNRPFMHNCRTGFHVADLELSNNPLQSITEMGSLEEFMTAATMADRDFVAERNNLSFVVDPSDEGFTKAVAPGTRGGSFGPISVPTLKDTISGTVRDLAIPRRPKWDETTTAEELHRMEKDSFLEWRRSIAQAELQHGGGVAAVDTSLGAVKATVTPFEKNIEVWKQLWRVVERSDVLVQIVDARNPLMYYSADLDAYTKEVNEQKRSLLLINKADFLSPLQRLAWAKFFSARNQKFVFFSAKRELMNLEEIDRRNAKARDVPVQSGPLLLPPPGMTVEEYIRMGGMGNAGFGDMGGLHALLEAKDAEEREKDDDSVYSENGEEDSSDEGAQSRQGSSKYGSTGSQDAEFTEEDLQAQLLREKKRQKKKTMKQTKKKQLEKAVLRSFLFEEDSGTSTTDEEESDDEDDTESRSEVDAADLTTPTSAATSQSSGAASIGQDVNGNASSDSNSHPKHDSEETYARPFQVAQAEQLAQSSEMTNISTSDPLYAACRVLTRDELVEFFKTEYADMPRGVLGTGSKLALQRRKEMLERKKQEILQQREVELRRRQQQARRMIEAGLGAQVRFGLEEDAIAMGEDEFDDSEFLESLERLGEDEKIPLQIGMIGFPNVGKSSTINAMLGATSSKHGVHRVAVASTPGKTKHFQTLILDEDITLCDCPGLVMPSFVSTREEMVVAGVLPIDQLRDHTAPIRLVCSRIPSQILQKLYGIPLPQGRQPTPWELLDAFGKLRGYTAAVHSGIDHPRAARVILKDYCDGRLVYCHPPPTGWLESPAEEKKTTGPEKAGAKPRVSMDSNVLLSSVTNKYKAPVTSALLQRGLHPIKETVDESEELSKEAARSKVSMNNEQTLIPEQVESEDEDIDSEDGSDSDSDSSIELTEEDLLAFTRVIPRAGTKPVADSGKSQKPVNPTISYKHIGPIDTALLHEMVGPGEDSDEDGTESGSVLSSDPSGGQKDRRAPRVKGIGKKGRLRKGEREADPYNTSVAADAVIRRGIVAEIKAVHQGPVAQTAGVDLLSLEGLYDSPQLDSGANASKGKGPATVGLSQGGAAKLAKAVTNKHGMIVHDSVPAHLRGQGKATSSIQSISVSVLKKAVQLQAQRNRQTQ